MRFVQEIVGARAHEFQDQVDSGEQIGVGVNAFKEDEDAPARPFLKRPSQVHMKQQVERLKEIKAARDPALLSNALQDLHHAVLS